MALLDGQVHVAIEVNEQARGGARRRPPLLDLAVPVAQFTRYEGG
jgi:hypothetical protein